MFVYIYKNVIVLHCHDELLNGDETGVDCGGSCEACKGMYYQVYYMLCWLKQIIQF